jgi:hypothetical protein
MKWFLGILTGILVVIHQDFWQWKKVDPLVGGFLPVGLWYHALFCLAAALVMALFVTTLWPKHLENAEPETPEARKAEGYPEH